MSAIRSRRQRAPSRERAFPAVRRCRADRFGPLGASIVRAAGCFRAGGRSLLTGGAARTGSARSVRRSSGLTSATPAGGPFVLTGGTRRTPSARSGRTEQSGAIAERRPRAWQCSAPTTDGGRIVAARLRSSVDRAGGFYPPCRGFDSCRGHTRREAAIRRDGGLSSNGGGLSRPRLLGVAARSR